MSRTYPTGVAATFESSVGSARSLWLGGSLASCVRVGPMCRGGFVRGSRDTHAAGVMTGLEPIVSARSRCVTRMVTCN